MLVRPEGPAGDEIAFRAGDPGDALGAAQMIAVAAQFELRGLQIGDVLNRCDQPPRHLVFARQIDIGDAHPAHRAAGLHDAQVDRRRHLLVDLALAQGPRDADIVGMHAFQKPRERRLDLAGPVAEDAEEFVRPVDPGAADLADDAADRRGALRLHEVHAQGSQFALALGKDGMHTPFPFPVRSDVATQPLPESAAHFAQ